MPNEPVNMYEIDVRWSPDDECYIASCPEFPGLSAFGDSRSDALAEAETALAGFVEVYEQEGWALPRPRNVETAFSGQLRVRMPPRLHAALSDRAKAEAVSLNTYIVSALSIETGKHSMADEAAERLKGVMESVQSAVQMLSGHRGRRRAPRK